MLLNLQHDRGFIPKPNDVLFSCWNINKSLSKYIRSRLESDMNITCKFLYPTLNDIKIDLESYWNLTRKRNLGFQRIDYLKSINSKLY